MSAAEERPGNGIPQGARGKEPPEGRPPEARAAPPEAGPGLGDGARARILAGVRAGAGARAPVDHPGDPPRAAAADDLVERFTRMFEAAGGEVVRIPDAGAAGNWLAAFVSELGSAAVGSHVPPELRPPLPEVAPADAALGVSLARFAAADTGTLLLDSREGRLLQLLPPVHLVWVRERTLVGTLAEALALAAGDTPSALALHSGPSKSADLGGELVRGVHGPGRVVAALVG